MSDSFAAAGEAAMAHLSSQPAETASDSTPAPDTTTTAPAAADAPATDAMASSAAKAEAAAIQAFKVKVGGEEKEVQLDELLNGYSRHSDYTKKTMELAEQRRQFEAQVASAREREAAINAFLKDANQVAQYYSQLTGQQLTVQQAQQLQAMDPNAPATLGQTEQMLRQSQEQLQQQVQQVHEYTQRQLQSIHEAEQAKRASAIDGDLTATIKSILSDDRFTALNAIDDVGEVLCADAMKLQPRSIEEAKAAILQVAHARAEKLNAHFESQLKASAAKQAKLANGIEPPGGTGVTPQPTKFKLGDKSLTDAATAFMQNSVKK